MKLFLTFSKKSLAVILAATVIALILLGQFFSIRSRGADGSTNAKRLAYLQGLGYAINDDAVTQKSIVIPEEFSEVYEQYNRLQGRAGFDLTPYQGKKAVLYTYRLTGDEEHEIHLLVADGTVIGGDCCSVRLDGEMLPLNGRTEQKEGTEHGAESIGQNNREPA